METTGSETREQLRFGTLLRQYRRAAGLSQEALAERARLSVRAVSAYERGLRKAPYRDTVRLLVEALGLSAQEAVTLEATVPRRRGPAAVLHADAAPGAVTPTPGETQPESVPNNLPLQLTSFVGRERELAEVTRLLATTRLLTLTGTGGIGKTRLALQAATALQGRFPHGVWLVDLAPLADPAQVPRAVAAELGVPEDARRPLAATLADVLRPRQVLLVLDNCEHLIEACALLVDALLRACPDLHVLATSREALCLAGETAWRVPSLALPDPRCPPDPEALIQNEAAHLFLDRALSVHPHFVLTGQNVAAVAEICRRLDGIPLAIELAAARVLVLSVEQITARLDQRFRLLTGGSRAALPRQQTLRATLDWSYDLLTEPERGLLRRLSVFAGGCTLEAAEGVCAGDGFATEDVLDLLAGLVIKSLVTRDEGGGGSRYQLLETVRQYAHEKLAAAGEAEHLRDRHLDWYLALAVRAAPALASHEQAIWLERLETELENLRVALAWATMGPVRKEKGVQLVESAGIWWYMRGHVSEAQRWLEGLLERGGALGAPVRARALQALGTLAWCQCEYRHAMRLHETAYALFRDVGDPRRAADALFWWATQALYVGDHAGASKLFERAIHMYRELGNMHGVGRPLCHLGTIPHLAGDYAAATACYEESLALLREAGDAFGVGNQLANLANIARDQGDQERATRLHRESLAIRRTLKDLPGCAESFEGLAVAAAEIGQPERAARLFGAAEPLREAIGRPLDRADRAAHDRAVSMVRAALGEDVFTAAWAEGQAMTVEQAIAYALGEPPSA